MGVEIGSGLLVGTAGFGGAALVGSILISFYVRARTKDLSQKKDNCM